jgi:hypothetical protein
LRHLRITTERGRKLDLAWRLGNTHGQQNAKSNKKTSLSRSRFSGTIKEPNQPFAEAVSLGDIALPQRQDFPSVTPQLRDVLSVSLDIAQQLRFPVADSRFWHPAISTSLVLMPEAALHENDLSPRWEHEIRNARQVAPMQGVAVPEPMEQASDLHLGLGVRAPDPAHDLAAA